MVKIKYNAICFLVFTYILNSISFLSATIPTTEVSVSTSGSETSSKNILPQNQNAPNVFEEIVISSFPKKYDWQAELLFFSDSFNGIPALVISGKKGKNGFAILYSNSILPNIRNEGAFLRGAGVPIQSVTQDIFIKPKQSSATYTFDLVDEFNTRTQFLEMFYYRQIYKNKFMCAGMLIGLPFVYHYYKIAGILKDDSEFTETGNAFGMGFVPGLIASFGSVSALDKGLVGSVFLIYNNLWFKDSDSKVAKDLRTRLNDFRFGFSIGWRFNFY